MRDYRSIGTKGKGPSRKMDKAPIRVLERRQSLTDPRRSHKYPQMGLAMGAVGAIFQTEEDTHVKWCQVKLEIK